MLYYAVSLMGVSFCSNQGGVTTEFPTLKGQPQQKAPPTTQTNKPKASKRGKEEVTALSVGSWLIDWIVFYAVSAILQPYNGGGCW